MEKVSHKKQLDVIINNKSIGQLLLYILSYNCDYLKIHAIYDYHMFNFVYHLAYLFPELKNVRQEGVEVKNIHYQSRHKSMKKEATEGSEDRV